MESSYRRLIGTEKINQRGHGWGGGETWEEKVNTETEQLASLPRISPSGLFGFSFLTQFMYVGLEWVVIIVVLFFFSSLGGNEAAEYGSPELSF